MAKDIKNLTKQNWQTENVTNSELQVSALMRIADASEAMAGNYQKMLKDLEFYLAGYRRRGDEIARLERRNSALRGVITRLKTKIK